MKDTNRVIYCRNICKSFINEIEDTKFSERLSQFIKDLVEYAVDFSYDQGGEDTRIAIEKGE